MTEQTKNRPQAVVVAKDLNNSGMRLHVVSRAVVAPPIQDDFMIFDHEAGRCQAFQITRTSLQIKNPFALPTLETLMVRTTG